MNVDGFVRSEAAGVDGARVVFYDFGPDLNRFACSEHPIVHETGVRNPGLAGQDPAGQDKGSAA